MSDTDASAQPPRDRDAPRERVDDPDSFNQTERLRQIHRSRRNFHDRRQSAVDMKTRNEINYRQYTTLLLHAFQHYFYELEGLMRQHSNGDHYLEEVKLGELETLEYDEPLEFVGLESLAGSIPPVAIEGATLDDKRGQRREQQILTVASEGIIMRAFRECNKFVAEAGLDAEMEDTAKTPRWDYSDLVSDDE